MTCTRGAIRVRRRSRNALFWGVALFAVFQVALTAYLKDERSISDFEFDRRLASLKQLIAQHPGRPLFLVLGSSRSLFGIRPELLVDSGSTGASIPIFYNFSVPSGGPLQEVLYLQRLLSRGIRPQWLLVECWTVCLAKDKDLIDDVMFGIRKLKWGDLPIYRKCKRCSRELYADWLMTHISQCYTGRDRILADFAPALRT